MLTCCPLVSFSRHFEKMKTNYERLKIPVQLFFIGVLIAIKFRAGVIFYHTLVLLSHNQFHDKSLSLGIYKIIVER